MKLLVVNGSPRGKGSNTKILLDRFLDGFCSVESDCTTEVIYLRSLDNKAGLTEKFSRSDFVVVGFPLYTDAMPGIVKELIETWSPGRFAGSPVRLGFIVQSGFPESNHSAGIRRYLDKLAVRLGVNYLGTAVKGGVEGISIQPRWMSRRTLELFYDLGQHLALDWTFDPDIVRQLARPVQFSKLKLFGFRLILKAGLGNFYWDMQLKNNHAFENRFARPYDNPLTY